MDINSWPHLDLHIATNSKIKHSIVSNSCNSLEFSSFDRYSAVVGVIESCAKFLRFASVEVGIQDAACVDKDSWCIMWSGIIQRSAELASTVFVPRIVLCFLKCHAIQRTRAQQCAALSTSYS